MSPPACHSFLSRHCRRWHSDLGDAADNSYQAKRPALTRWPETLVSARANRYSHRRPTNSLPRHEASIASTVRTSCEFFSSPAPHLFHFPLSAFISRGATRHCTLAGLTREVVERGIILRGASFPPLTPSMLHLGMIDVPQHHPDILVSNRTLYSSCQKALAPDQYHIN